MLNLQPTVAELLEERISDAKLNAKALERWRALAIELALIAVPAVLRAGHAGNVTCRDASRKILALLHKK